MTEKELRTWMRRESLDDSWFVSLKEGQVSDKPVSLAQIRALAAAFTKGDNGNVLILHVDQQNRKEPAWVEFDTHSPSVEASAPAPLADDQPETGSSSGGRRSRRRSRRRRGIFFQMLTLFVVALLGWGGWYLATREKPEAPTREMNEAQAVSSMLLNLERNLLRNPRSEDLGQTPIRTVVSATQRMLMVKNSNLEPWSSFNLKIVTPDGRTFTCVYSEEIPAYSTLSISMRKIMSEDGQGIVREDLVPGTLIELDIPGYQPWSSKL